MSIFVYKSFVFILKFQANYIYIYFEESGTCTSHIKESQSTVSLPLFLIAIFYP